MKIGFDIISDMYLTTNDTFDWEGKPTSLYCLVAGNISQDIKILSQVLSLLGKCYQGVFFIDGCLEIGDLTNYEKKVRLLQKLCANIQNIVYLHNNVVILNNIALVGLNGWNGNYTPIDNLDNIRLEYRKQEDYMYLANTIEKLQIHVDVSKVILMSNSAPAKHLYFGEREDVDDLDFTKCLKLDSQSKITHWVYGTYNKMVNTNISGVNYINNGCYGRKPYWPTRVEI